MARELKNKRQKKQQTDPLDVERWAASANLSPDDLDQEIPDKPATSRSSKNPQHQVRK